VISSRREMNSNDPWVGRDMKYNFAIMDIDSEGVLHGLFIYGLTYWSPSLNSIPHK
jgi:hypothetical protein